VPTAQTTEAVHRPTYCYVAQSACYSGDDLERGFELFHEQTLMPTKHQASTNAWPIYCYVALSACYSGQDLQSSLELFHIQMMPPQISALT
jgi:hypothetical protein